MKFIAKIFWNENERRIRSLWRLVLQIVQLVVVLLVLLVTTLVGLLKDSITPVQLNIKAINCEVMK